LPIADLGARKIADRRRAARWYAANAAALSSRNGLRKEKAAGRPCPEHCEICHATGIILFDHDHASGAFRGWICKRCNTVLGLVRDSVEHLELLIRYLS
jgi:hypothetical protein